MNRKPIRQAALCTALACALLTGSAGAYTMEPDGFTITPNQETLDFWSQYKYPLNDQGVYEHSADNWNFCPEFHDGLLLVQDGVNPPPVTGYWDNYVDKNGKLHDLNQGRYWIMSSFSGGLAAVGRNSEKNNSIFNVGYIDLSGNEVIPCNEDWCRFQYGTLPFVTGRFENGRAVVLRQPDVPFFGFGVDGIRDTATYNPYTPERWYGIEYAYIDTKGNYLTEWTLTQDINTVISLPLYDQDGIRLSDRINWNSESNPEPGGETPEPGETQQPEEQPYVPEHHVPALPEYNKNAPSLFASTAKVTGFGVGMADLGSIEVTVTNPGTVTDAGVVALAAMNEKGAGGRAGVFFISYEVAGGSSQTYSIPVRDIIHEEMFGGVWDSSSTSSDLLEEYTEMSIITFADDADLHAFYDTIPYEQYWHPTMLVNDFQPVCDGATGSRWLEQTLKFHRDSEYGYFVYELPNGETIQSGEVDHSLCET